MNFVDFFRQATQSDKEPNGRHPYPFQQRFAEADPLSHLVRAPTGAGKTATAVLGWLWRYFHGKKPTPCRLVYCLPMRVLVEQSTREAENWIKNLGLAEKVKVHVLMGGVDTEQWYLHPERPAVLIGTQDMLLSRALNRGYAANRFHWPIDFGLLNNDSLWVFDEPQLMASGVSTSAQLAGLREKFGTFGKCLSVWMSATLEPGWLGTVDFRRKDGEDDRPGPLELKDADYDPARPLHKRMTAAKVPHPLGVTATKDGKDVAKVVWTKHEKDTQTLVIVNTVDRAKAVYDELVKLRKKASTPALLLVHSRFRPHEREKLNANLQDKGDAAKDRIIVATQVVEAGVDISSRTLVTELAPWASVVQRIGRCNRTGDDGTETDPARVFWVNVEEKTAPPYEIEDIDFARKQLEELDGRSVSPKALDDHKREKEIELPFVHKHVVRRRDVMDLFDTAPDLSGNDIDVARFVRGDEPDADVQVFWRDGEPKKEPHAAERRLQEPNRNELCNVPIGDFKKFLDADKTVYRWDFLDEKWRTLTKKDASTVVPGHVFWVPADQGGYDQDLGWDATAKGAVRVVQKEQKAETEPEHIDTAFDSDDISRYTWRTIAGHTTEVMIEFHRMLDTGRNLPLTQGERAVLEVVVRWHDWGKAHDVFQSAIESADRPPDRAGKSNIAKAPDGFWTKCSRNTGGEKPTPVSRFRHELASALGILALDRDNKLPADWQTLSQEQRDLALYLIAAHHGKVRLSIRVMPEEKPVPPDPSKTKFAAGVWDGDELPVTELGNGTTTEAVALDLSPMLLGNDSWTARVLGVRDRLGPFRLAYLEALVRAADCRASAAADGTKEDGDA